MVGWLCGQRTCDYVADCKPIHTDGMWYFQANTSIDPLDSRVENWTGILVHALLLNIGHKAQEHVWS